MRSADDLDPIDVVRRQIGEIERALQTLGLLRKTLETVHAPEGPLLEALLEVADSAMTYRRRYMSGVQAAPVLDLLSGEARQDWEHSIVPMDVLRYSVTFRSFRPDYTGPR